MTWPRPSSPGRLRKPVWATRPAPEPSRRDQLCRGHGLRAEVEVWSSPGFRGPQARLELARLSQFVPVVVRPSRDRYAG